MLELLTTLAVATILVSVAVPGLQSITAGSRQASAVNELVSAVHVARSAAITQNTRVSLCASTNGSSCGGTWTDGFVVFVDADSDQAIDAGETVLVAAEGAEGLDISSTQIGSALTFRSSGRTTLPANGSTVGHFTFCDGRGEPHARSVIIELSGRPRLANDGELTPSC